MERIDRLYGGLSEEIRRVLSVVASMIESGGGELRLVGGSLRDLILGREVSDFDLLVDIDLPWVFESLEGGEWFKSPARGWKIEKVVFFDKYLTGKIFFSPHIISGVDVLDISQMRKEVYPFSGSQPVVSVGDERSDVQRRDFSINALSLKIFSSGGVELVDRVGGVLDLERFELRVLHDKSFVDDPARLLRAVRFIVRFGLAMEKSTKDLFLEAVAGNYLLRLPKFRLLDEFKKVFTEKETLVLLSELNKFGIMKSVFGQDFIWDRGRVSSFIDSRDGLGSRWRVVFCSLFPSLLALEQACSLFELPNKTRDSLCRLFSED